MEVFEEDEEVSFSGVSFSKRNLSSSHNSVTSMGSVETPTRTALKDISNGEAETPPRSRQTSGEEEGTPDLKGMCPTEGTDGENTPTRLVGGAGGEGANLSDAFKEDGTAKADEDEAEVREQEQEQDDDDDDDDDWGEYPTPPPARRSSNIHESRDYDDDMSMSPKQQHAAREALLRKNQDIISVYKKQGRRSTGLLEDAEETDIARIHKLERELSGTRESLFKAEEKVDMLQSTVLHWQEVASQHTPSIEQTGVGLRALDKARMQQERLESVVDRLLKYVDAETIIQEANVADDGEEAIRNRAVRKSLEMMTTLREEGEETEGGGEGGEVRSAQEQGVLAQALRELALVAKLKNEAVGREEHIEVLHNRLYDASAREREIAAKLQQSKEENEELNKLTGEMQSAHARLLVMFQNMAEQKKGESAASAVAADSGEMQAKIDELTCAKKSAEEKASQLQGELDVANEEVERLELEVERGFEDKVGGLEAELRRSREDAGLLEGKHEMIMKRCMELESNLKVSEDKVVELEGMATASEELVMELKGALLESEEIAKEAGDKCKKLEELAEEEGAAAGRLAGLEDEVAMWRERAETFEGVVKAGEACIQELKRGVAERDEQVEGIKGAMREGESKTAGLEARLRTSEERVAELEMMLLLNASSSGGDAGDGVDSEAVRRLEQELSAALGKLSSAEVSLKAERDAAQKRMASATSKAAVVVAKQKGQIRGPSTFMAVVVALLAMLLMLIPSSGPYELRAPLVL